MANKYLNDTGLQYFFNKLKTIFLTNVAYDSTNKKLTKTLNGTTSDIVTVASIKSAMSLAKGDVGLGNVDNTADANKTVSKAGTLTTARNIEGVDFDGSADASWYATCPTAAATANKVATITPTTTNFSLKTGAKVFVKFTYANSVSNSTLNVNGTGAKPIYYNGAAIGKSVTDPNGTYEFVYNGTQWELVGDLDTNSTYTNAGLGQGYGVTNASSTATAVTADLSSYALTTGGIVAIKFTHQVSAEATLNINGKGAKNIFYKGSKIVDDLIGAGNVVTLIYDGTQYHVLAIDIESSILIEEGGTGYDDMIRLDYNGHTYYVPEAQAIIDLIDAKMDWSAVGTNPQSDELIEIKGKNGTVVARFYSSDYIDTELALKAPLASPALTGTPTAPTAAKATNTTQIATTAFVKTVVNDYAPKASPALTGTPTAPTATAGTNTTQIATTAFVKSAVDTAIAGVTQFDFEVVTSLPTTGVKGKIYLVAHSHGTGDAYDEYIWTGSAFEKIGNTDIDLSGYMLKTDMVAITTAEIDTLFA